MSQSQKNKTNRSRLTELKRQSMSFEAQQQSSLLCLLFHLNYDIEFSVPRKSSEICQYLDIVSIKNETEHFLIRDEVKKIIKENEKQINPESKHFIKYERRNLMAATFNFLMEFLEEKNCKFREKGTKSSNITLKMKKISNIRYKMIDWDVEQIVKFGEEMNKRIKQFFKGRKRETIVLIRKNEIEVDDLIYGTFEGEGRGKRRNGGRVKVMSESDESSEEVENVINNQNKQNEQKENTEQEMKENEKKDNKNEKEKEMKETENKENENSLPELPLPINVKGLGNKEIINKSLNNLNKKIDGHKKNKKNEELEELLTQISNDKITISNKNKDKEKNKKNEHDKEKEVIKEIEKEKEHNNKDIKKPKENSILDDIKLVEKKEIKKGEEDEKEDQEFKFKTTPLTQSEQKLNKQLHASMFNSEAGFYQGDIVDY